MRIGYIVINERCLYANFRIHMLAVMRYQRPVWR